MGADSTIVNAAFLEARSRAEADVPDMSKLYEGQREISKTFLKGFTDMFDEMKKEEKAMKASKDAQLRAFKAQAKKSRAHLLDQEAAQPMKVHDVIYDKFKALEEEFKFYTASGDNDTPENEKMRASLYAQLQLITNQAVKSRGTIATKATLADSLVGGAVSEQDIAIGRAIMGVDGNYDNVELSFNAKGQLVYHVGLEDGSIHSWTIDDFEEKMITHDNAIDTYQATRETASYSLGNKTKQDFNGDEETSSFLKTVLKNDENIFKDIVYSEINGRKSFYDSLLEDTGIAKVAVEQLFVENVKVGLVDVNKDGVVDMLDYDPTPGDGLTQADVSSLSPDEMLLWKQNHLALVDALVNTDNPAFSFDISSELLATDFVGGLEDHFNEGRGHKEPVGRGGRGGRQDRDTYDIGGSWHEKIGVDPTLKALNSGKDYEPVGIPFNTNGQHIEELMENMK